MASGVVWATELVIRACRKHPVAVEGAQFHAHAAGELGQTMPLGAMVESPADMTHSHAARIFEFSHVGFDEFCLEPAADILNKALFDRVGDGLAHVGVEGQKDIARSEHDLAVNAIVSATGEYEGGWPMIPAPWLVGVAIFGDRWIHAEFVDDVRAR